MQKCEEVLLSAFHQAQKHIMHIRSGCMRYSVVIANVGGHRSI